MTRRCVTDEQYGNLWRRATELVRRVDEGTISYNFAMDGLQPLIEGITTHTYGIVVDYSRSLIEMIKAGNYDWVDSKINAKNFPLKDKGEHEMYVTLFHFDHSITSEDVIAKMINYRYRLGTIEQLLALGEGYPNLQKEFPITAFGSIWQSPLGHEYIPCLARDGSGQRCFHLSRFALGHTWVADWRFLAVRK